MGFKKKKYNQGNYSNLCDTVYKENNWISHETVLM